MEILKYFFHNNSIKLPYSLKTSKLIKLSMFIILFTGSTWVETTADPYNVSWEILSPLPLNTYLNDAEMKIDTLNQNIYLTGGVKGDYSKAWFWKYDLTDNEWVGNQMNRSSILTNNQVNLVNNLMLDESRNTIYAWNYSNQSVIQIKENNLGTYEIDFQPTVHLPWNTTIIRSLPIFNKRSNQFLFLSEYHPFYVSENPSYFGTFTSIFDLNTQSWMHLENSTSTDPFSISRGALYHNLNNNEILYFNRNIQDTSLTNKTWNFNLNTMRWSGLVSESYPTHIGGMDVTLNQYLGKFVGYGGRNINSQSDSSELWTFDSQTTLWDKVSTLPLDMAYSGAHIVHNVKTNNIYYLYGSYQDNSPANDFFVINISGSGITENLNLNIGFSSLFVGVIFLSIIIFTLHRIYFKPKNESIDRFTVSNHID